MQKYIILLNFVFALTFNSAWAQSWQITKIKGDVKVTLDGKPIDYRLNADLPKNSQVETSRRSKVRLKHNDTTLWVGSRTKFKIRSVDEKKHRSILNVIYGKVRAKVSKNDAPNLSVETKSAVAGVRGTEFFVSSDIAGDFICTLEGKVAVRLKGSDEEIEVPEGKGLVLKTGELSNLAPSDPVLVAQWLAETDTEDRTFIDDSYDFEVIKHKQKYNIYTGIQGQFTVFKSENNDFYSGQSDSDETLFSHARLQPHLQFGKRVAITVAPIAYIHSADKSPVQVDKFPYSLRKEKSGVNYGDLNLKRVGRRGSTVKFGYQKLEFLDGHLMSSLPWTADSISHLGLLYNKRFKNFSLDLISTNANANKETDGLSSVSYQGIKIGLHNGLSNIFYLNRNFDPSLDGITTGLIHSHNLNDLGLLLKHNKNKINFKFLFSHQDGTLFEDIPALEEDGDGDLFDFEAGYFVTNNVRLNFRYIRASEEFVPGEESYYPIGIANIFRRNNLKMWQFFADWQIAESHSLRARYAKGEAVGTSLFSASTGSWGGEGELIGKEINLIYKYKHSSRLNLYLGIYQFTPGIALNTGINWGFNWTPLDTSTGAIFRMQFTY